MTGVILTITADELRQIVADAVASAMQSMNATPPAPEPDRHLSLSELCEYLPQKPKPATVYQWTAAGTIPFRKTGKHLCFLKSEIDQWLANHKYRSHEPK